MQWCTKPTLGRYLPYHTLLLSIYPVPTYYLALNEHIKKRYNYRINKKEFDTVIRYLFPKNPTQLRKKDFHLESKTGKSHLFTTTEMSTAIQ